MPFLEVAAQLGTALRTIAAEQHSRIEAADVAAWRGARPGPSRGNRLASGSSVSWTTPT